MSLEERFNPEIPGPEMEPPNPYALKVAWEQKLGPAIVTSYYSEQRNPLHTQFFLQFDVKSEIHRLPEELKAIPDLVLLGKAHPHVIARMFCGPAALEAAINSSVLDQDPQKMRGYPYAARLITSVARYIGSPAHDPASGELLPQGWQAFAKGDPEDVSTWDIRHQTLILATNLDGQARATAVRNFRIKDLLPFLTSGGKVVASMDNCIIEPRQMGKHETLTPGTHLVALIGASPKGEYVMIADPYQNQDRSGDEDHIPRWQRTEKVEQFLKGQGRGIAVVPKAAADFTLVEPYLYDLPMPEIPSN